MSAARVLFHLGRADFLERVRRHAFLVTLGFTVYAAYIFLPPNHAHYVTLQIGGHRGIYNSAWVGSAVAMLTTTFLSLAGFYLVRNAVERDRMTGVGEILATTPIGKPLYAVGKTLSNFAVLATMVAVVVVVSAVMQLALGEERRLDPGALLAPFVFLTLPAMAVVAAVAVLSETVSWLSGGLGNVVYFFAWIFSLSTSMIHARSGSTAWDPIGAGVLLPSMFRACERVFPGFRPGAGQFSMGINIRTEAWHLQTFPWNGVEWTWAIAISRLGWFVLALAIALVAAVPFDRFDTARARAGRSREPKARRGRSRAAGEAAADSGPDAPRAAVASEHPALRTTASRSFRFAAVVAGELRLMLKGLRGWWVIALGLVAASLLAPLEVSRGWLLPIAWGWPLLIWSEMGARESRHQTGPLIFSSALPLRRQLPAIWVAGVLVALFTGGGVGVRLALAGRWEGLALWGLGAVFIPTLALALGVWSGSGKLFQVIYLALWYVGPMSHARDLDFMGTTGDAIASHTPAAFLAITAMLITLAWVGRRRQVRG